MTVWRVYYNQAVWRFRPILGACLPVLPHLSGGLRLRIHRGVAGNHKLSSQFSDFACFWGDHSNREPSKESPQNVYFYSSLKHFEYCFSFVNSPIDVVKPFCSLVPGCSQKQFDQFSVKIVWSL